MTPPIVVLTMSDTSRGTNDQGVKTGIGIIGISNKGFNARLKTQLVSPGLITVYWIAISK